MIIYSFPYAAGSSYIFNDFKSLIKDYHQVISIDYPGHGKRFCEELLCSIEEIAADAIRHISFEKEYALLGYSMGTMVVLELLRTIVDRRLPLPVNVYLCALEPPIGDDGQISGEGASKDEVLKALRQLNGTPEEFFDNEELIDLILPIVRKDFLAASKYKLNKYNVDSSISFYVIYSNDENTKNITCWKNYLGERVCFSHIDGTHFFIHNENGLKALIEVVVKSAMEYC